MTSVSWSLTLIRCGLQQNAGLAAKLLVSAARAGASMSTISALRFSSAVPTSKSLFWTWFDPCPGRYDS